LLKFRWLRIRSYPWESSRFLHTLGMLFKFLLAIAGQQSLGLRPEAANVLNQHSIAASVGRMSDLVASAAGASASDSLESLSQASEILGSMMTAGNATAHMSDDDAQLLRSVITLLSDKIYGSMDLSHQQDLNALQSALDAIEKCNSDILARLAPPDGDFQVLYEKTLGFQSTLNDNQTEVEQKTEINNTKFGELETHISTIQDAPACEPFPTRPTKAKVDVFFTESEYVNWYTARRDAYAPIAAAFEAADGDLAAALRAYEVALASRDVSYCDWKLELTNGCNAFDECYAEKLEEYQMVVTPRVRQDMEARIDAFKAGELIIAQIKFLLADETSAPGKDDLEVDTSRYEITFSDAAAQGECSLAPLDAVGWVPAPMCDGGGNPGK